MIDFSFGFHWMHIRIYTIKGYLISDPKLDADAFTLMLSLQLLRIEVLILSVQEVSKLVWES